MGKRELVLIALFAAVGIVVYQFTAPPPPPGSEGVSVGGIFQKLRREMQGARESATAESRETLAVDSAVRLVRVSFPQRNDITITGSDRNDIAVEMKVTARGYDQAEAKAAADAARIKLERTGEAIAVTASGGPIDRRGGRGGYVNQGTVTILVPRRLSVRMEPHIGQLFVSDVAGLEVIGSRGETRVTNIAGSVTLNQTGSRLELDTASSVKLTTRNVSGTIKHISGALTMEGIGGDELRLEDIAGPVAVEARNLDLSIDAAKMVKPPFRFNGTGGQLRVENLRTESRVDGRDTEIEIALAAPAPVTIYNTGENIVVTAPPGGYALDAVATEGRLTLEDGNFKPAGEGEQRVTGAVRGGGPTLTLRATRGEIRVRKPEGK